MRHVTEYAPEHIDMLDFNKQTEDAISFIGKPILRQTVGTTGPAFTGMDGDHVIAISGVNIMWPGCGEAWVLLSKDFKDHGFWIHRKVSALFNWIIMEYNLERVQAVVLYNHAAAIKWVERLGFMREGLMQKYYRGQDFWRYARVIER